MRRGFDPAHNPFQQPPEVPVAWPELEGQPFEVAAAVVQEARPDVSVVRVEPGQMVTADIRPDRVRVRVDAEGVVSEGVYVG